MLSRRSAASGQVALDPPAVGGCYFPGMIRVPYTAGEKESLHASLNRHRDVVLWKLEGLDDEQLRRPLVPSGTTMLGLVKHLGWVEYGWFCETFGRETEPREYDEDDPDADLRVEADESTAGRAGLLRQGSGGRGRGDRRAARSRSRGPRGSVTRSRCAGSSST